MLISISIFLNWELRYLRIFCSRISFAKRNCWFFKIYLLIIPWLDLSYQRTCNSWNGSQNCLHKLSRWRFIDLETPPHSGAGQWREKIIIRTLYLHQTNENIDMYLHQRTYISWNVTQTSHLSCNRIPCSWTPHPPSEDRILKGICTGKDTSQKNHTPQSIIEVVESETL